MYDCVCRGSVSLSGGLNGTSQRQRSVMLQRGKAGKKKHLAAVTSGDEQPWGQMAF